MARLAYEDGKFYLKTEFAERDEAKAVPGARWLPDRKRWSYAASLATYNTLREVVSDLHLEPSAAAWLDEQTRRQQRAETLKQLADVDLRHPSAARLYPHQRVAAAFAAFAAEKQRALIADLPGLGKTAAAIVAAEMLLAETILLIVPNSLKLNWKREILGDSNMAMKPWAAASPHVFISDGSKTAREKAWNEFVRSKHIPRWFIINYEAVRLMPQLADFSFDMLICDESHALKNRKSKQSKAVKALNSRYMIQLTGTPILNRPDDLWHLLHLLDRDQFSSYWRFRDRYCRVAVKYIGTRRIEEVVGAKNVEELQKIISPYFLRRPKDLLGLPEKVRRRVVLGMNPKQRKLYKKLEQEQMLLLDEGEVLTAQTALVLRTRLRQIASTPAIFGFDEVGPKVEYVKEWLTINPTEPLVVFSRFRTTIDVLEKELKTAQVPYVRITGSESMDEREAAVRKFQASDGQIVCLATIQAGGVGLTLTKANTMIFMDRDETPALNEQAEDRIHRIGQDQAVEIQILVLEDSVEYAVESLLAQKEKETGRVLGDESIKEQFAEIIMKRKVGVS